MSVAIGELADGLRVDLDKVPKKYAGLDEMCIRDRAVENERFSEVSNEYLAAAVNKF